MEKNNKYDKQLFLAVIFLTLFGYIMVISAHANVWIKFGPFVFAFEIFKITVFIALGIFLMTLVRKKFNINWVIKNIRIIFIVVILLMIATLFFAPQYGARAWIRIPGLFSIQPVEFLKLTLIIYFSYHFGKYYQKDVSIYKVLKIPVIMLLLSFGFVFILQNDLGGAMILLIISLCMFMAIPEKKYTNLKLIILGVILVSVGVFYFFGSSISEYIFSLPADTKFKAQLLRIATLFNPLGDVYTSGYQLSNALVALSEGGLFGQGLGQSDTKFIVPEPYNDAIIAVIAEELGIIGVSIVFIAYIYIVSRLLGYAKSSKVTIYDRLILIGIASFFMAQFFVNVGGMVGLIPMTGVTLLFISSGGSSIITAFLAIGIAQGVIKRYIK